MAEGGEARGAGGPSGPRAYSHFYFGLEASSNKKFLSWRFDLTRRTTHGDEDELCTMTILTAPRFTNNGSTRGQ